MSIGIFNKNMFFNINTIRHYFVVNRRSIIEDKTLKRAGVLIPLFEQNNELLVLLTKRTEEVEHHKGQVSFPGGMMESKDTDIIETALREAEEEIGLKRSSVEILGLLDDFQTPSGFCITPAVGFLPYPPQLSINTAEVAELFSVPLDFFLNQKNVKIEKHELNEKIINVYVYKYKDYKIWGATAAILRNLLKSLNR